ncbi:MFS general substrate transporter [Exidia glandulosa HHB12029]|uniref:MFS general substrate transporter n=1 Tax=Exidia glandulosa HHB12029 TaxID=1314781 RepID=A0A165HYB3_EXIGL|nr:MFS general substrate transporter [Exidia glandulosa HHB12029]
MAEIAVEPLELESYLADGERRSPSQELSFPDQGQDLLPVDTGFAAYSYLFANFVLELLVWSYAFSYAVFLPYYANVVFPHHANLSLLSLIGTLATGIMYMAALVVMRVCPRYPWIKRPMMLSGLFISTAALVGAAFSTEPWQLLLTQGVVFSIGGSALYYPATSLLCAIFFLSSTLSELCRFEWFVERRGLVCFFPRCSPRIYSSQASGLILSGTGIGGIVVPFMVNALLYKYGMRSTFLAMAGILCLCVLPILPFLKSRYPANRAASSRQAARINYSVFRSIPFWCLLLSNWMQSLGHSVPSLYLPAFASDLHLSGTTGVLVLALLNGASVPGRIFMGFCSDRFDLRIPMLLSCLGSAGAVFFLWGFTNSTGLLVAFALCYGFTGGGFSSMWPRFVSSIAKDDPHTSYFLMSTFYAGRGIAYIVSTPISTGLLNTRSAWGSRSAHYAYGMKGYGVVIFFTGMILLGSGIGVASRSFGGARR